MINAQTDTFARVGEISAGSTPGLMVLSPNRATLLTFEIVVVAWLGRGSTSPAFVVAIPFLAVVLILRVLLADDNLARAAAGSLLNLPLLSRVGACLGMGLAGGFLVRAPGASARLVGRIVSGGAGLVLLFALSLAWTRYQGALESAARASGRRVVGDVGWRIQVGLSVLWTVYAALALAWGFAQAVLSAIWAVEDGFTIDATNSALRLAAIMRPMLRPDDAAEFKTS